MNVTLLVPELLHPPAPLSELDGALPPVPALRRLLGRADRTRVPAAGLVATQAWLAGVDTLPAGALTALAAGDEPGDGWWLRADPVHLAADADGLRLLYGDALEVTDDEAATLTAYLTTQLDTPLRRADAAHWYFARAPLDAVLHAPATALGRRIEPLLPAGPDGRALRSWLNEVQMLLHAHPVNLRRAEHGQYAINSVWPWGGGTVPAAGTWRYDATYADDPVLAGLAGLAGQHAAAAGPAPRGLAQLAPAGRSLVQLDALQQTSRVGDVEGWLDALASYERDWFAPAHAMLADGALRELVMLDCSGNAFTMRPWMRWRFWRRDGGLETD